MANKKPQISLSSAEEVRDKITAKQAKQIKAMFTKLAKEAREKAKKLEGRDNISSIIQKKYLEDLAKELEHQLNADFAKLKKNLEQDMTQVSESVIDCVREFEESVGMPISNSWLNVPVDAVEAVQSGKLYAGNWTLSSRIWGMEKKVSKDIHTVIAEGIAANKSAYDIAKDLEKYVDPKAKKDWNWSKVYPGTNRKVDYSAQRLARTMVSHAYQFSFVESTKDNPFITKYKWISSHDKRVCPICKERDGKLFDKDKLPLDHPNGRCTFVSVFEKSSMQISDEMAAWVKGKEGDFPKIDEYMKKKFGTDRYEKAMQMAQQGMKQEVPVDRKTYIDKIKNSGKFDDMEESYRKVVFDYIEKMPDDSLMLFGNTIENVTMDYSNLNSSSYRFRTGLLMLNEDVSDDKSAMVFFHEFGHYIDDTSVNGINLITKIGDDRYSFDVDTISARISLKYDWAKNARIKDLDSFLKKVGFEGYEVDEYAAIRMKDDGRVVGFTWGENEQESKYLMSKVNSYFDEKTKKREYEDFLYDKGMPRRPNWDEYYETYETPKRKTQKVRERYKGAGEKYQSAMNEYYDKRDKFEKEHDMSSLYEEMRKAEEKYEERKRKVHPISDSIDAIAGGQFGSIVNYGGHTTDYYGTNDNAVAEIWANYFQAKVQDDREILDMFEEVMPETKKILDECFEDIVDKARG